MADIILEVVSPEETVLSEKVDCVFLPGVVGQFEVLKNHAPLITSLAEGTIRYRIGNTEKNLPILSGFVEVMDNRVSVCAEMPRRDKGLNPA